MPVDFRILPDRGLVVVRYHGFAAIEDTLGATRAYTAHPLYAPGQKQLVDFSDVVAFERDYVRFMLMQAAKAGRFANSGAQSLVVYIAPTAVSQEFAAMFIKSWDDVDAVVPMVQHSEAQALALLGASETSVDALWAEAGRQALQ